MYNPSVKTQPPTVHTYQTMGQLGVGAHLHTTYTLLEIKVDKKLSLVLLEIIETTCYLYF